MEIRVNIPGIQDLQEAIDDVWSEVDSLRQALSHLDESLRCLGVEMTQPTDGPVG